MLKRGCIQPIKLDFLLHLPDIVSLHAVLSTLSIHHQLNPVHLTSPLTSKQKLKQRNGLSALENVDTSHIASHPHWQPIRCSWMVLERGTKERCTPAWLTVGDLDDPLS